MLIWVIVTGGRPDLPQLARSKTSKKLLEWRRRICRTMLLFRHPIKQTPLLAQSQHFNLFGTGAFKALTMKICNISRIEMNNGISHKRSYSVVKRIKVYCIAQKKASLWCFHMRCRRCGLHAICGPTSTINPAGSPFVELLWVTETFLEAASKGKHFITRKTLYYTNLRNTIWLWKRHTSVRFNQMNPFFWESELQDLLPGKLMIPVENNQSGWDTAPLSNLSSIL